MKVLIVDDKTENLYLLESLLKGNGHVVEKAEQGAVALEKLRAGRFDLIIADILMPVMDGFALCRQVKGDEKLRAIPFVFYTATYTDQKDEDFALGLGAAAFIRKPAEPDKFIGIIERVANEAAKGLLEVTAPTTDCDDGDSYKLYSERLVAKLDRKVQSLEAKSNQCESALLRVEHLNRVLYGVRGINKLIVREQYRDRLIQEACGLLVNSRGYFNAWIVLLTEEGKVESSACAGDASVFAEILSAIDRGDPPQCVTQSIKQAEAMVIVDPATECHDCPGSKIHHDRAGFSHRLFLGGGQMGVLTASLATHFIDDPDEVVLFAEVASDIEFALLHMAQETKLAASQQRYASLFKRSKDSILMTNQDNIIIEANAAAVKMFGYTLDELIGMNAVHLHAIPEEQAAFIEQIQVEEILSDYESSYLRKDGSQIICQQSAAVQRDGAGHIVGYEGIFRDITDLKQAFELQGRSLTETIAALGSMTDIRDPYTAGHQVRVAVLALEIARLLDVDAEWLEGLRRAAVVHDIGKISVPAEILVKPTKLTPVEFSMIQDHSSVGSDILGKIHFRRPVAQIVRQHHERLDGSGYPDNLKGSEILLEARIIAVADVVEAMSSHRPYRPALGIDKALEEISNNKGILYDGQVVDACLGLFTEKAFAFGE